LTRQIPTTGRRTARAPRTVTTAGSPAATAEEAAVGSELERGSPPPNSEQELSSARRTRTNRYGRHSYPTPGRHPTAADHSASVARDTTETDRRYRHGQHPRPAPTQPEPAHPTPPHSSPTAKLDSWLCPFRQAPPVGVAGAFSTDRGCGYRSQQLCRVWQPATQQFAACPLSVLQPHHPSNPASLHRVVDYLDFAAPDASQASARQSWASPFGKAGVQQNL